MVSSHTAAAIAQTVFYAPIVPVTLYLMIRNWRLGPKLAFISIFVFSLFRLAGGIIVIILGSQPTNLALNVTAIVFLNVGLIPLIRTNLSLVNLVIDNNLHPKSWAALCLRGLRMAIMVAIALLTSGSSLLGQPNVVTVSKALGLTGYFMFTAIICGLTVLLVWLRINKHNVSTVDYVYVRWMSYAMPFLLLRAIYGLLYSFTASTLATITTTWNPLFGSAVAFALMALLPEYIVLCAYIYLGFHRKRTAEPHSIDNTEDLGKASSDVPMHKRGSSRRQDDV